MDLIKISQLDKLSEIVGSDFFPIVDSGSKTTLKATVDVVSSWAKAYATASWAIQADAAGFSLTASYARSCSLAFTTSYLYYTASFPLPISGVVAFNGTASYAIYAGRAITASYIDASNFGVRSASFAFSASWVETSVSTSYVFGSVVDGTVFSASYTLNAPYAITASNIFSSSYAVTSSNALTSSHVFFASNSNEELYNVYGPFVTDANSNSTVEWGQYDEYKRSVAFILEEQSDVVIKCLVNYNNYRVPDGTVRYRYFGVKVSGEGLPAPIINEISSAIANSELNAIEMASIRDISGGGYTEGVSELTFKISNLGAGQHRVFVVPLSTTRYIGSIEYAVSASNAQITDYNAFMADAIFADTNLRIPKFLKAVQVLVYAKKSVFQGIYPPDLVTTWKLWNLTYSVTDDTLSNGQFEYIYDYNSVLGNGTAYWYGPTGIPGESIQVSMCLPTDHVITSVQSGPMGTITSGPIVTTTGCDPNGDYDPPCGQWIITVSGQFPTYINCP